MHYFPFFLAALASASHQESEETVTITQIITECTESSSYSFKTLLSSISSTLSNDTPNTLSTSTIESSLLSRIPATLSSYTFHTLTNSTVDTVTSSISGMLRNSTFIAPSASSTNAMSVCIAGISCSCIPDVSSNCTYSPSSPTVSSIDIIEASSGIIIDTLSGSISNSTTYVPTTTSRTTIGTPAMISSSQQESKPSSLPEFTTTTTRTRTETYYAWYPDSESQIFEETELSISMVHSWHNAVMIMTVTDTITATTTDTTTAIITDMITATLMETTIATTTTSIDSGASKNVHPPCKVFHHRFHNITAPRWNHTVVATAEHPSLSLGSTMSRGIQSTTVTIDCPLSSLSLSPSSPYCKPTAAVQLPDGQLQPTVISQNQQPYLQEQISSTGSVMGTESYTISSLPTKTKPTTSNSLSQDSYSTEFQTTVPSSMSLPPERLATIQLSTIEMPIPNAQCLLDQGVYYSGAASVAGSGSGSCKMEGSAKTSRILSRASKSAMTTPTEVILPFLSSTNSRADVSPVRELNPDQDKRNWSVERPLPVTNQANKTGSTSAPEQTNTAQAKNSDHQSLPVANLPHEVVSGSVHKPLIPIQQDILTSLTQTSPRTASNHTFSTTTTIGASIRIMTGTASSIGCSHVALVVAVVMLIL